MTGEDKRNLVFGLLVAAVAFLVYANSLGNGFVWDDTNVVVTNPALKSSPFALFSSIDTARDYELLPYYRPLTMFIFLLEERLHGLVPLPMHLVNILLHAGNAFLVYRLARSLAQSNGAAALAGLLFAVHPINTEAVDFISARNTLLACFFVLVAYLLHRRSVLQESLSLALAAAVALLAGLFSKETALAVLPFILAREIAPLRQAVRGSRLWPGMRLFLFAAAAMCYLVMRWLTLSPLGIQTSVIPGFGSQLQSVYKIPDLWTRLTDNLYIIPRYLLTLVWPNSFNLRYTIPDDFQSFVMPLVLAWLGICAIVGWLLTRGQSRATLFGLLWLAAFYLPVSGMVMFPSSPMADRYMYLPAIGLWIIAADRLLRVLPVGGTSRRYSIVAAALVIVALAGLTVRRNLDWKSDISLFARFAEQYPEDAYSHAGLGNAYFGERNRDRKYLDLAETEYKKALALKPVLPGVYTNMGYIRLALGDSEGAVRDYTIALSIYPMDKEALLNRAIALENLGKQKEALDDFKRFLSAPGYELSEARPYAEGRIRELTR